MTNEVCSECGERFTTLMGRKYFLMDGNEVKRRLCRSCADVYKHNEYR